MSVLLIGFNNEYLGSDFLMNKPELAERGVKVAFHQCRLSMPYGKALVVL